MTLGPESKEGRIVPIASDEPMEGSGEKIPSKSCPALRKRDHAFLHLYIYDLHCPGAAPVESVTLSKETVFSRGQFLEMVKLSTLPAAGRMSAPP